MSPPSAEAWTARPFGAVTIATGVSGGATVAIVNDGTTADGGWMQRFVNFEPPFQLSVRGRYDPATTWSDVVTLASVFTGTHTFSAQVFPTSIRIGARPTLSFPAVKGTWYNITFDAKAILDVDVYLDGVLVGNAEMVPVDRIIFDQPVNKPAIATIVSYVVERATGMVDYIRTTMCPPTDVPAKTPDRTPPVVFGPTLDDGMQPTSNDLTIRKGRVSQLWLNGTVDDSTRGDSNVWSANYTIGPRAWPGAPMAASDGSFDSPTEPVTTAVDVTVLGLGTYSLCIYGRDYYGNWDPAGGCATLNVVDGDPPLIQNVTLDDGVRPPATALDIVEGTIPRLWLNATVDDTQTGGSVVNTANYTVGAASWPGTLMGAVDGAYDQTRESVSAVLPAWALRSGTYALCVYAEDEWGNGNMTGGCGTLTIRPVPDTRPPAILLVSPSPGTTDVAVGATVSVVFSEPMDVASAEAAFSFVGPQGAVSGSFRWSQGDRVLEFLPTASLAANESYTATVRQAAHDPAGNSLPADTVWSFATRRSPSAAVPPAVNWKPTLALAFVILLVSVALVFAGRAGLPPDRIRKIFVAATAFSGVELLTGVASTLTPALAIPPTLGLGTILDGAVLAAGLACSWFVATSGRPPVPPQD